MNGAQQVLDRIVKEVCRTNISPQVRAGPIAVKQLQIDPQKRTIDGVISTERVDRDKEVVLVRGLDLSAFRRNPVVLFMHDAYSPVGKCNDGPTLRRRKGVTEMVATTKFADTPLANEVFALVEGEFLRGISIGMNPRTIVREPPTPAEVRKKPEWADARDIVHKAELIEYSFVSIPANAEALTTAVNKGLIRETEPYLERFIRAVTDAEPRKRFVRVVKRNKQDKMRTVRVVPMARPDKDWRTKRALRIGRL